MHHPRPQPPLDFAARPRPHRALTRLLLPALAAALGLTPVAEAAARKRPPSPTAAAAMPTTPGVRPDTLERMLASIQDRTPRPASPALCEQLARLRTDPPAPAGAHRDLEAMLAAVSPRNGARIWQFVPWSFGYWWHQLGPSPAAHLSLAIHEASHDVQTALQQCHGGAPSYFLDGEIYTLPRDARLATPYPHALAAEATPALTRTDKYEVYVRAMAHQTRNDFYVLMDEWVAYLAGTEAEMHLALDDHGLGYFTSQVFSQRAGLDGAAHFKLYALLYLQHLHRTTPVESLLASSPELQAWLVRLIQMTDAHLDARRTAPTWAQDLLRVDPAVINALADPGLRQLEAQITGRR